MYNFVAPDIIYYFLYFYPIYYSLHYTVDFNTFVFRYLMMTALQSKNVV
jgi:hypothetical protein